MVKMRVNGVRLTPSSRPCDMGQSLVWHTLSSGPVAAHTPAYMRSKRRRRVHRQGKSSYAGIARPLDHAHGIVVMYDGRGGEQADYMRKHSPSYCVSSPPEVTLIPFSFARVLQFSAMSARLFELKFTSGDRERLSRRRPIEEAGVARLEPFEDDDTERRLNGE